MTTTSETTHGAPDDPAVGTGQELTSFGQPLDGTRLPGSPSQTVGPFLSIGLAWEDGTDVVPSGTPGAIEIGGTLLDGAGAPIPDGIVETWQADPDGRFDHPDDPRGAVRSDVPGFRGFGRSTTDTDGHWWVRTVRPGSLPTAEGPNEAPHLDVTVMARGMLDRVVTRVYLPDSEGLESDPVLADVPAERRHTLIAQRADALDPTDDAGSAQVAPADRYRFDIRLQGPDETVFFDL